MITMCIFRIALLRACFGCNNSQKQAWRVQAVNTYSSHWALFFALFCYTVCTQNGACFNPDDPRIQSWKVGKPRYKSPTFRKSLLKKWWFRRRFAFLSGIAYMILGAMKLCTVFFCFGRIKICDGLSQVHLISWTRRRNWKNPMVGGFSSQLF